MLVIIYVIHARNFKPINLLMIANLPQPDPKNSLHALVANQFLNFFNSPFIDYYHFILCPQNFSIDFYL